MILLDYYREYELKALSERVLKAADGRLCWEGGEGRERDGGGDEKRVSKVGRVSRGLKAGRKRKRERDGGKQRHRMRKKENETVRVKWREWKTERKRILVKESKRDRQTEKERRRECERQREMEV